MLCRLTFCVNLDAVSCQKVSSDHKLFETFSEELLRFFRIKLESQKARKSLKRASDECSKRIRL
ncbi:CLUMA_CG006705, isoform A [Clunio marinus]|uniref:CLUMA_CG006705, isoform A n=1 Tax=Clunio marinus TaxID=568069 RepID=A0A1J1HYF9_9DIPT|nr:CLUMA_CG006705, isoform A [Clunio marinus]